MNTDTIDSFGTLIVFHKHIKGRIHLSTGNRSPRVAVPLEDIQTIAESHLDGTTLVRTTNGGTIAIAEDFITANKIWNAARSGGKNEAS